jgi:uncharacterized protein
MHGGTCDETQGTCTLAACFLHCTTLRLRLQRGAPRCRHLELKTAAASETHLARRVQVATALAAAQPAWNFTLMFVMGGAIAIALPLFQFVILKREKALDGTPLALPKSNTIDWMLVSGGVLFGAGWGAGGMCPGPAVVALANGQTQVAAMVAAMVAGMALAQQFVNKCDVSWGKPQQPIAKAA